MGLTDVRRGLAANLRAIEGCQVSPYLLESPSKASLQVAGVELIEKLAYGADGGLRYLIVVEGATGIGNDVGAQLRFDHWLDPGAENVWDAVEADPQLTSRLGPDGVLVTGQDPAADDVGVVQFRNMRRHKFPNGTEGLLGEWVVQVITS